MKSFSEILFDHESLSSISSLPLHYKIRFKTFEKILRRNALLHTKCMPSDMIFLGFFVQ